MILLYLGALLLAVGFTPWMLARLLAPHSKTPVTVSLWGPAMVALNTAIPVLLHLTGIRITATSLSAAHLIAAMMIGGASVALRHRAIPPPEAPWPWLLTGSAVLFTILVIPVTHLAGIDTYKWQDLAGNIAVEGRIAWLIHPLSLFGFTPRSYPSAQPLLLATIEILGHTGVDWGFYLASVALGLTGLFGAWRLGLHLFPAGRQAAWFAFLYCFAPVFARYNYWATGRGMLLAFLPLFLLAWFRLPGVIRDAGHHPARLLRALLAVLAMSILLALSHKAGFIGAILIPILLILAPLFPVGRGRLLPLLFLAAALAAGLTLTGFAPATLIYRIATRFGWLAPLMMLGIGGAPARFQSPVGRAMLAASLTTLVLSFTPDMYGALLALPFVTYAAVVGLGVLEESRPIGRRLFAPAPWLFGLTLLAAIAIIINQAKDSPDNSVYRAAMFLERYDPKGPFRIEAPGRARTQIQGYVSGCPRFSVEPGDNPELVLHPPPAWSGNPARDARRWIDYLRDALDLRGTTTDWYGTGTKVYAVTVNGEGAVPAQGKLIYSEGAIKIYATP